MEHYMSINDLPDVQAAIAQCKQIKQNPNAYRHIGKHKTLGLIFMNPSLRTKISTLQAAMNLGMDVLPIDFNSGAWSLEFDDNVVMDTDKTEHVKEAAAVIGQYCDMIAIRSFAQLKNKTEDSKEKVFQAFQQYSGKPIINLESALRHPLQTLTDLLTIEENKTVKKPKVVLSWAPHVKALPHAVANSFVEGMQNMDYEFVITHPKGYELDPQITQDANIEYNQDKALENADFVYVKNWSSYQEYGEVLNQDKNWTITKEKMSISPKSKLMHCLPVRRDLVVGSDVLDSSKSIVIEQAYNRLFAAQYILKYFLEK